MSEKTTIQRIVSQNDAGWVTRNSVSFRDFHPAFIPRPPTIGGVHASPLICSDLVIRPNRYAEKRADIFRDAEVVGSNPAVPTQKVLVRGFPPSLRPVPRSFHPAFIEHPDSGAGGFWSGLLTSSNGRTSNGWLGIRFRSESRQPTWQYRVQPADDPRSAEDLDGLFSGNTITLLQVWRMARRAAIEFRVVGVGLPRMNSRIGNRCTFLLVVRAIRILLCRRSHEPRIRKPGRQDSDDAKRD